MKTVDLQCGHALLFRAHPPEIGVSVYCPRCHGYSRRTRKAKTDNAQLLNPTTGELVT